MTRTIERDERVAVEDQSARGWTCNDDAFDLACYRERLKHNSCHLKCPAFLYYL
jgi:hypothetical protein